MDEIVKMLNNGKQKKDVPKVIFKLWKWILAYKDPTDIGGVQYPNEDKTRVKYLISEELPFDCDDYGIIFADEFDRATPETQNSFLQILLGGEIHGHELSKNAYTILAMNGTSDIFTTPLSEASRTRVCTLFLSSHAEGNLESWDNFAEEQGLSPTIRGFARFRPELIVTHEEFEELAIPTPRTRDMADQILRATDGAKFETADILLPCLAGVVGKATALELIAYKEMCDKCPDPDKIIASPETATVPKEPSVGYAVIMALLARVAKKDKKTAQAVIKYAVRMKEELTAYCLRKLAEKCPAVVVTPEYNKWTSDHKSIIM